MMSHAFKMSYSIYSVSTKASLSCVSVATVNKKFANLLTFQFRSPLAMRFRSELDAKYQQFQCQHKKTSAVGVGLLDDRHVFETI